MNLADRSQAWTLDADGDVAQAPGRRRRRRPSPPAAAGARARRRAASPRPSCPATAPMTRHRARGEAGRAADVPAARPHRRGQRHAGGRRCRRSACRRPTTTPSTCASSAGASPCATAPARTAGRCGRSRCPPRAKGEGLSRRELNFRGRAGAVPDEVIDLLRGFVRHAVIAPVAKLATRRHRVQVRDGDGQPLLEVADDVVSVLDDRQVAARFREVEVEVQGDASDELLRAVVDRLREAGAVVGRLARPRSSGPSVPAPPARPRSSRSRSRGDSTGGGRGAGRHRRRRDPAARSTTWAPASATTPRTCTRRGSRPGGCAPTSARSAISSQPEWGTFVREELRWLAGRLGAVRDTDVLLERLSGQVERLCPSRTGGRPPACCSGSTATARRRAPSCTSRCRATATSTWSRSSCTRPACPSCLPEAEQPATEVLPELVRKPWKQLEAAVADLGDDARGRAAARGAHPHQAGALRGRGGGAGHRQARAARWRRRWPIAAVRARRPAGRRRRRGVAAVDRDPVAGRGGDRRRPARRRAARGDGAGPQAVEARRGRRRRRRACAAG